jgi:hypothetical protein
MSRQEISNLLAQGEAFEHAGRAGEAHQIATQLLRAIGAARMMRRDNSTAVRDSDVDAIAWAQAMIEKHKRASDLAA